MASLHATSVEEWSARLSDADPGRRAKAEEALLAGGEAALPICGALARDPALSVRLSAARIMRKLAERAKVTSSDWLSVEQALLSAPETEVRAAACGLAASSSADPLPRLFEGLADADRAVSMVALVGLARSGLTFDPSPLIERLPEAHGRDPLFPLLWAALKQASPPADPQNIEKFLESPEPVAAVGAARALGQWRATGSAGALAVQAFSERLDSVRHEALAALARLGDAGLNEVIQRARSPEGAVREQAAQALGGFPDSVGHLMALLESDPYPRVRQAASRSLQRLAGLEQDARYDFLYDGPAAEQTAVVERWKSFWKERTPR